MATTQKKSKEKVAPLKNSPKRVVRNKMSLKRQQAIEKAILFWKNHSVDLSLFKFNREEANAR